MEAILIAMLCFIVGMIIGVFIAVCASDSHDKNIEASGVWTIKGRAYRLTRIKDQLQHELDERA